MSTTETIHAHVSETIAAPMGVAPESPNHSLRNSCVHEVFSRQASQTPHLTAIHEESKTLSYAELNSQADQLAAHLRSLGVGPEVPVGICMPRSARCIVAALAVLKAGGAYLPIDSQYPHERVRFILEDANVAAVLTDCEGANNVPRGKWKNVVLGRTSIAKAWSSVERSVAVSTNNLAYIIYTSGSTGTPKGVEITHASLTNLVLWHWRAFNVTSADRATQISSFGFDAAVWELWPYLTAGASVCVAPDLLRTSPELLRDWLVAMKITISFAPTPIAERLLLLEWPADAKLRFLLTGADTLYRHPRPDLPFQLINNYGPTEATVVATSGVVPASSGKEQRPSIGRAIDNTQVYVCDASGAPLSPGKTGELYIGGAGVARGYVNSPELTADKFVPDHFTRRPGAKLYRTGDMARLLPDGQLAYLGRADDLIKVRGFRIEPGEIIAVLNSHPGVQESAVVAREDATGNQRLIAYVVPNDNVPLGSSSLRALVREHLPDYMVPTAFVSLSGLPLTTHGKISREGLPLPDETNMLPDEDYVAPHTTIECTVVAIVARLLGLERVGAEDNFFLIGGHSLFGTQLIANIQESFGVELPLLSIFNSPTPALLSKEIESLLIAKISAREDKQSEGLHPVGVEGQQQ